MSGYGVQERNMDANKPRVTTCGVCGTECPKGLLCVECMKEVVGQSAATWAKSQRGEL
jgi:hypothetical protein